MKICFITCNPYGYGGIQRVLSVIASAFAKKHQVCILHEDAKKPDDKVEFPCDSSIEFLSGADYFDINGTYSIRKKLRRVNELLMPFKAPKILEFLYYPSDMQSGLINFINTERIDIMIAVGEKDTMLLALIANRLNCKCIGWEHNTYEAYFHTKSKYAWRQEDLFKKIAHNIDEYIFLTESDSMEYRERFKLSAKCIYNPLSFTSITKSKCDNDVILFAGRLAMKQKGLDYLAKIMSIVFSENSTCTLQILGDGEDRDEFKEICKLNGILDRIEFLGFKSNVKKYYCNASIFVLTSKWEGFGLVVTEAMECGLPVVSFMTKGPSEIITNGKDGILVENYNIVKFADAVLKLLSNTEYRVEISKNAVNRAKDFSLDSIIAHWDKVLIE